MSSHASVQTIFDPFAPNVSTSNQNNANSNNNIKSPINKNLTNPFLVSGPISSPKLSRRIARQGGFASPQEEESSSSDDEVDEEHDIQSWTNDQNKAEEFRNARSMLRRSSKSIAEARTLQAIQDRVVEHNPNQTPEELLKKWRQHQVEFIHGCAVNPAIADVNFQRQILAAGVFDAICNVIEDVNSNRLALLYSLGLMKRLTSTMGTVTGVKFSDKILDRLVAESQPTNKDPRIRACAINLLAATLDKKALEKHGFFTDIVKWCSPGAEKVEPIVENAMAIAITNFSLDVSRQRTILDTITMNRLISWAKSIEPDLKTCSAAFIGNLVANEECKYQIIHDGGLTILTKLIAAPGKPTFKNHAARGLANLAIHPEAHIPMLEHGTLEILKTELANHDEDNAVFRSCLRCLMLLLASGKVGSATAQFVHRERDLQDTIASLQYHAKNPENLKHAKKCAALLSHADKKKKKKKDDEELSKLTRRVPSYDDISQWNVGRDDEKPTITTHHKVAGELHLSPRGTKSTHTSTKKFSLKPSFGKKFDNA